MKNRTIKLVSLFTIVILVLTASINFADAARKRRSRAKEVTVHIPVEVIDSLKASDISSAIRNMRMEAASPRSKYLLREMQRIDKFETGGKKMASRNYRRLFNIGVAYHNIFLFLKGHGYTNEAFFKKALKYYKKASKTKSPFRKNNANLTMAALYAANGDTKKAEKIFSKIDPNLFNNDFRKYETMALYYSSLGNVDNTIVNLEEAYQLNPDYTKFWLGISDDFYGIYNDKRFQTLMKKWNVKVLNRGTLNYTSSQAAIP